MSILDNEAGTGPRASKNSAKLVIRVSSRIDGRVHQRKEGERFEKSFSSRALEIEEGKKIWWKPICYPRVRDREIN